MSQRMKKNQLNIGVHHLHHYARTEEHIRDVVAAGVEFVTELDCGDRKSFDLFAKYGLGVIVTGVIPKWGGGGYGYVGRMQEKFPPEVYAEGMKNYVDHPAFWGVYFCDEPNAADFRYMGEMVEYVNSHSTDISAYLNLYPNYAQVSQNTEKIIESQLGTPSYEEYIEQYCKYIPTDYISFDYYAYGRGLRYTKDEPNPGMAYLYENLRVVANACRATGRSLWFIGQVNSYFPEIFTSTNQIRMQAFAAMAFGVENIQWGCYTAGWWHNQVLDKTEEFSYFYMDNYYLKTLVEMGYIGLIFFVILLVGLAVWGIRAIYQSDDGAVSGVDPLFRNEGNLKVLTVGIFSGMMGVLLHCYFENIFEEPYMMAYFWGLAAAVMYAGFFRKRS